MQQVQDRLDFKIETPSDEEVRRRFEGSDKTVDKLKSLLDDMAQEPVSTRESNLENTHRHRAKKKAKNRAARKARRRARA